MASKTTISNIALSHLGSGKEISDYDTEQTQEAKAVRTFYDLALKEVMSEGPWPRLTKRVALGLVGTNPNDDWTYSYRYPSNAVFIHKIQSGQRNDTRDSRVEYKIEADATGALIYTDTKDAVVEYNEFIEDPDRWSAPFTMAFTHLLAYYIAPRVTKGDPFRMQEKQLALYKQKLSEAQAKSFNEEQPARPPEAEFIRGRV